jgi:hypothetical protein
MPGLSEFRPDSVPIHLLQIRSSGHGPERPTVTGAPVRGTSHRGEPHGASVMDEDAGKSVPDTRFR